MIEPPVTEVAPPAPSSDFPTLSALLAADQPVNLSHAGGDLAAPHSTMFAFNEGLMAGADALEMDVQLTGDGVLIVQHDTTVDRTTDAAGSVADLTLSEIQSLDNAYWFVPQCWSCQDRPLEEYVYRGVRHPAKFRPLSGIQPTISESRPSVRSPRHFLMWFLDVEIKGSFPDAVPAAEALAAEIDELGLTDRIVVVSFDDQVLDAFHEIAPDVALSPGLTRLTEWFPERRRGRTALQNLPSSAFPRRHRGRQR